jgi:DNA damage-binding protein 1
MRCAAILLFVICMVCVAAAGSDSNKSSLAVIGSWSRQVKLLSVPDLNPVAVEELGSDIIPRSVALADFEGQAYVLCGLGDGQLHNWRLDPPSNTMSGKNVAVSLLRW